MKHAIVVGAGFSGGLVARELTDAGWKVTVFEKSRGAGGRLSTRRQGDHLFDHGATRIEVSDALQRRLEPVLVHTEQGWRGSPGMSTIVRHLLQGIHVEFQTRVERIDIDGTVSTSDNPHQADLVVCTAPLPQTATLFGRPTSARYASTAVAMVRAPSAPVFQNWQAHGTAEHGFVLRRVVNDEEEAQFVQSELQEQLGSDVVATHFWRFSQAIQTDPMAFWLEGQRAACGDGFGDITLAGTRRAELSVEALLSEVLK
jgi:predicted NAD/FAD-dependent oxidoreductase